MSFEPLAHARTLPARLKSANIPADSINGRRGRCAPGPQPGDGPCISHLLEPPRPEEDGDDTDSETSESVTTSSEPHSPLPERVDATAPMDSASHPVKPLIINTEATPPPSPRPGLPSAQPTSSGKAPAGSRPPAKRAGTIRKLFRRTNSHPPDEQSSPSKASPPASNQGAGLLLLKAQRKSSFSISAENSPSESETNTPPTPGSPVAPAGLLVPPAAEAHPKPNRSSTGLSLKLVGFSSPSKQQRPVAGRVRSPSSSSIHSYASTSSPFSLHAAEGAGVKARRTSAHLPEDFYVETAELDDEFVSASKIGRRKEIGKGATATVKIMVRRGQTKGDQYAVKEFRKRAANESEAEYVRKVKSEYSIAKSLNHPNIVKTVRLCTHAGRWNHVMEYCQNGELFSLVGRKYLQQEDKLCFFKQVLRGVAYLHDNGIAHRDIKLENLLLTDQGHVKITDFGVSEVFCGVHPGSRWADGECGRKMEECRRSAPGICGSLPYIAPEVLAKTGEYDPRRLDVWSCAILYLTMFHGGNVWPKADRSDPHYRRFAEGWDDFLATHPEVVVDENHHPNCGPVTASLPNAGQRRLILKMLHPIPERRITIRDALKDRCVKNIECCVADEDSDAPVGIDFASKDACRMAAKMKVQKKHNHQPPPLKRLPQHRFDMGDGTSRYD